LMFTQGFFGVFPWNVITYWIFKYLATERGYTDEQVLMTMVPAVLVLAAGYPLGGALGDYFFKRSNKGRLWVSTFGVLAGAIMLFLAINVPIQNTLLFGVMFCLTAIFIPFAAPNVVSTVYDITLPEVRSSALAIQYFVESSGAALAPLVAGIISDNSDLKTALLLICITTWIVCGIVFALATRFVPKEIDSMHKQLRDRAAQAKAG
jgi:MFS family permease